MFDKLIDKFENKLTSHLNRYESKINTNLNTRISNLQNKENKLLSNDTINEKLANNYNNHVIPLSQEYYDTIEPYFDFARITTKPLTWPYYLYLKMKQKRDHNVLFADGVHFFVALQGGGKSTIAFELIERLLKSTGKSAYVNAKFEHPRLDPISKKYYKHFQYFELLEFFDMSVRDLDSKINVSQLKKFNRYFDTIVLDEWLTEMNHRLNKTKDYNNIFMALLTMIAHMRHQKMRRIYVLSQIDNTDIQLLSMFKYVHEIEIDLTITYDLWIQTGRLDKHVRGWHVWTYGVKRNRKQQSTDKVLIKKQYLTATADFDHFDTFAQAEKYDSLPEDNIKFLERERRYDY